MIMPSEKEIDAIVPTLARLRGYPSVAFVPDEGRNGELRAWAREVLTEAAKARKEPT